MKGLKPLSISLTVAWFAASLWWISRGEGCACGQASAIAQPAMKTAVVITSGPASTKMTAVAPSAVLSSAVGVVASNSTSPFPGPRTISFVKNVVAPAWSDDERSYLQLMSAHLIAHREAPIVIVGHTDADGDAIANKRLSLIRAEQVKAALVEMGAPANAIRTIGMGADGPVADNVTSKGKAQNRRVEITLDPLPPGKP